MDLCALMLAGGAPAAFSRPVGVQGYGVWNRRTSITVRVIAIIAKLKNKNRETDKIHFAQPLHYL